MRPAVWIALTVLGADQASKAWAVRTLGVGESWPLLPHCLHLTLVYNTGGAFGLLRGHTAWFLMLSFAATAMIGYQLWQTLRQRRPATRELWALSLILGGAVGNGLDRLRLGYVIDFLDFRVWPVFNIADSAITIGAGWLVWQLLRPKRKKR
ncbi:MAG: signal peptidase II [Candidatus Omnitrophica bacterium]|nr:signal peptidase II [Candidatus Omnitrophota bacterium]